MATDRGGMTTKELWDDVMEGMKLVGERLGAMEADPSISTDTFAGVIEQSAEVLEQGVHADLAADLRAQGFAILARLRLDGLA